MNVNTIGFPFASPTGAPVFGTADQGFALALGTISGFGTPKLADAAPQGNAAKTPLLSADDTPVPLDARALVRAQPGSPITLAQLLTAGSKLPIADVKIPPAETGQPAITSEPAGQPPVPGKADAVVPQAIDPQPADTPVAATTHDAKRPEAAPAKADPNAPVPCGLVTDELPAPLDLPTAARPIKTETAAATVATPAKTRKPVAIEPEAPALPLDPLAAQPAATPAVPAMPVPTAAPAPQPAAPAAASGRKSDGLRVGKAVSVAPNLAEAPVADASEAPAAKPAKIADTTPNGASLPDAALPKEAAAKAEGRAAAPQQSFASQVSQPPAPAPAHAAATTPAAPAAAADPMIPARAGQLGHALGVEIARKVGAGEDTLRVRLNPVELGRVEVTLAFDDTGNLRATMRTESQHALDLLRQDAPDLGRALDSAGIRADTQSFRFENRSDGNSGSGGQPGQHQSRGNSQHGFKDEPETSAPVYRAIRNDGQVDLLA